MKKARRRIDVNLEELDRVLDGARQAPLSESDHGKLKDALHALASMLVESRNTEKTSAVVGTQEDSQTGTQPDTNTPPPPGHGRNGAEAFGGARKVDIKHQKLTHGDRCPECGKGNVYGQKEPKVLVRIVGHLLPLRFFDHKLFLALFRQSVVFEFPVSVGSHLPFGSHPSSFLETM
jgi:hypothetical protein